MSRPIGAIEQEPPSPFIDREAMMMDGGRLFFQLTVEDDPGDTAGEFLSQFAGQTVFTQDRQAFEVRAVPSGSITTYRLFPVGGGRQLSGSEMRGLTFVDNLGVGHTIGTVSGGDYPLQSRTFSESALARFFGVSDTGTSAPSFSSTQAAQTQAEEFARGESRLDRAETARLEELRAKNARRLELMGNLTRLAETARQRQTDLLGLKLAAEQLIATTLRDDPVGGAILQQGQVQRGTTPVEAARTNTRRVGQQAATQATQAGQSLQPNLSADIPGLEAQIAQVQSILGQEQPTLPTAPIFGLEHGGEVVKAGKDETPVKPFSSRPDPMTAFRFAEQMGLTPLITGEREGGPELVLAAKGTQVIPLDDREEALLVGRVQGAQEGFFDEFDQSTIEQAISPIFENLGFEATPRFGQTATGGINIVPSVPFQGTRISDIDVLNQLGIEPRLLRFGDDPTVFFRDPSGTLRSFGSQENFEGGGFSFADVVNINEGRRDRFTFGDPLTAPPPLIEPGVSDRRFPLRSAPLMLDFPEGQDFLLPAARQLANIWRTMGVDTQNVILSAFGAARQGAASFLEEISFFTPTGTATRAGAAAFG